MEEAGLGFDHDSDGPGPRTIGITACRITCNVRPIGPILTVTGLKSVAPPASEPPTLVGVALPGDAAFRGAVTPRLGKAPQGVGVKQP